MTLPDIATPCHCALLRKASRHVSQFYDSVLQSSGLKTTQFSLLRAIYRRADRRLTMGELAEILVMDRSTLGHNLRPLERAGLVRWEEGAEDRRVRFVILTARGRKKCEASAASWNAAQERFESQLGGGNLQSLREALLAVASLDFEKPEGV